MKRRSRSCRGVLTAACLIAAVGASSAPAHERSVSYSRWTLHDHGAEVSVRLAERDLTRFPPPGPRDERQWQAAYVAERARLLQGGEPCEAVGSPLRRAAAEGWREWRWSMRCTGEGALTIVSELMLEVAPAHLHFARIEGEDGVIEHVLSADRRRWRLAGEGGAAADSVHGTSFVSYLALGVEHILTGYDHLAFVIGLLLLAASFGEVATLVTGFTLAHSITLAVAVLGLLRPQASPVEALIGFSIALVGAENAWLLGRRSLMIPAACVVALVATAVAAGLGHSSVPALSAGGLALFVSCYFALLARSERPIRLRTLIAFCFGLVHGFGFAGILAEMSLPTDRLAAALVGFNVGVELGQLAVVAVAYPVLRLASRSRAGRPQGALVEAASAGVCGLGLYWFVLRAFG